MICQLWNGVFLSPIYRDFKACKFFASTTQFALRLFHFHDWSSFAICFQFDLWLRKIGFFYQAIFVLGIPKLLQLLSTSFLNCSSWINFSSTLHHPFIQYFIRLITRITKYNQINTNQIPAVLSTQKNQISNMKKITFLTNCNL